MVPADQTGTGTQKDSVSDEPQLLGNGRKGPLRTAKPKGPLRTAKPVGSPHCGILFYASALTLRHFTQSRQSAEGIAELLLKLFAALHLQLLRFRPRRLVYVT